MINPKQYEEKLIEAAAGGLCAKDRRAAALVSRRVFAISSNGPPAGFICAADDRCFGSCGRSAVHAEMRTLLKVAPQLREGAEMIHARLDYSGAIACSGPPRCLECAKHMFEAGVAGLWLYHRVGWTRYPMFAALRASAEARQVRLVPGPIAAADA